MKASGATQKAQGTAKSAASPPAKSPGGKPAAAPPEAAKPEAAPPVAAKPVAPKPAKPAAKAVSAPATVAAAESAAPKTPAAKKPPVAKPAVEPPVAKPAAAGPAAKKPAAGKPAPPKPAAHTPHPAAQAAAVAPAVISAAAPSRPAAKPQIETRPIVTASANDLAPPPPSQAVAPAAIAEVPALPAAALPTSAALASAALASAAPASAAAAPAPPRQMHTPSNGRPPVISRASNKDESFAEGDYVVYPTHGVGKVEKIAREEIAGHHLELIHITFEENRMTLRVPVAKARSAGLRRLSTRKMFDEALAVLKGRARVKRTMWSRRAQEYEAKINSGDPQAIAEVVRDLHRNAGQPDQSFSERQIYEAAMDRLAAELAALDQTDKAAALVKLGNFLKTL